MAQDYYLMHHGVKGMKWGVRRTPEQLGHRPSLGQRTKTKLNDPEFQRKAVKAAKIALAVGTLYAGHKVLNNPQVIALGKDVAAKVVAKSGAIKASAIKAAVNSTEFKAAKVAGHAGLNGAKAALKVVQSDKFRKTVTGVGAIATTAGVLRNQIKDLKKKPEGDAVDKALGYAKKGAAIGETMNTLAKGGSSSSSSSQSSSSQNNNQQNVSVFTDSRTGQPIKANKKLSREDKDEIKRYRANHPNMTLREALDELGWLDKDEVKHSSIRTGWSFNSMAGCRYIF